MKRFQTSYVNYALKLQGWKEKHTTQMTCACAPPLTHALVLFFLCCSSCTNRTGEGAISD